MPCEDACPIRWLFHKASEYGVVPPTQKTVALPLSEGDDVFCVIENSIPLQGEGEQSTKFGGTCPYWPHPCALCKWSSDFPESLLPLGAGLLGGGLLGAGL